MKSLSIIEKEWFKIAAEQISDPHAVEDYLDCFETFSKHLLNRVVNLADTSGNTAMHYAISHSNFDIVSVLLDSKVCDVNKQNKVRSKFLWGKLNIIKFYCLTGWVYSNNVGIAGKSTRRDAESCCASIISTW